MKNTLFLVEDTAVGIVHAIQIFGDEFEVVVAGPVPSNSLRLHVAACKEPRIIVTKLMLGRGDPNDVYALISEMRKLCPNAIIVAWTKLPAEYHEAALRAGANLVCSKYVHNDDIKEKILQLLK